MTKSYTCILPFRSWHKQWEPVRPGCTSGLCASGRAQIQGKPDPWHSVVAAKSFSVMRWRIMSRSIRSKRSAFWNSSRTTAASTCPWAGLMSSPTLKSRTRQPRPVGRRPAGGRRRGRRCGARRGHHEQNQDGGAEHVSIREVCAGHAEAHRVVLPSARYDYKAFFCLHLTRPGRDNLTNAPSTVFLRGASPREGEAPGEPGCPVSARPEPRPPIEPADSALTER
jgi:hypothetical protein